MKIWIISIAIIFLFGVQIALSDEYADEIIKGKNYYDQGKYEEALNVYNQLIEINPNSVAILYKPYPLLKLHRYDDALNAAEVAISKMPEYPLNYGAKAMALVGLDRYDEAIEFLTIAQEIDPVVTKFQEDIDAIRLIQEKNANGEEAANKESPQIQPLNQLHTTKSSDQIQKPTLHESDKTGRFNFLLLDDDKSFYGNSGYLTEDGLEIDQINVYYLTEGASGVDIENPWTGTWNHDNEVITFIQEGNEVSGTSIINNITQSFLEGYLSEDGESLTGTRYLKSYIENSGSFF